MVSHPGNTKRKEADMALDTLDLRNAAGLHEKVAPEAEEASAPVLDAAEYIDDLSELDLTEEQKRELLEILWSIMRTMVELGVSVDLCGQLLEGFNELATSDGVGISLERPISSEMLDDQETP